MLPYQRSEFDIPRDVAYLNCAYMSPLLRSVAEAGRRGVDRKAHPWEITPADFFTESEQVRRLFGELVNAPAEQVAIAPAASYGIATAALNLTTVTGSDVVLLDEQFPSNVYQWREFAREKGGKVHTVERPDDDDWTSPVLDAIGPETSVVALPQCHWTDGSVVDLVAVRDRCDRMDAALVVDATQSVGAYPFDVAEIKPDFLAVAAYKWMLGPYGLGFLYVSERYLEGNPIEHNWINREGSGDFSRLVDYQDTFQRGARRFDTGGRSNFATIPMALAALRKIHEWTVSEISATLAPMVKRIADKAESLGLDVTASEYRAGHMLGIRFSQGVPSDLVEALEKARVYVSVRGSSIRVSPHLHNDEEDLERFFEVLDRSVASV